MRLVADIGGTHCRFALADEHGELSDIQRFRAADYASVEDAIETYLAGIKKPAETACLAVAGPTEHDAMAMTNLSWRTTASQLNKRFGFIRSAFINDFEAIALCVPALEAADLLHISHRQPDLTLPIAVLGPGTGLGVAQLIPCGEQFVAIATEGGHTALQAATIIEQNIFDYWKAKGLPLSRESFLSGPGLLRLYSALCALSNSECLADSGGAVSDLAAEGDSIARQALDIFLGLLGSAAGDQALACGSRGGVVLAGGILPKISAQLPSSSLRERFEAKAPMQHYLKSIPVSLILHENPGLLGAAYYVL